MDSKEVVEAVKKHTKNTKQKRAALKQQLNGEWHYSLFMCCDRDCILPFHGCCCFLCGNASLIEELSEGTKNRVGGSTNCNLFCCCFTCPCIRARGLFRSSHNIQGSCLEDCILGLFCAPCSFCQIRNELDYERTNSKVSAQQKLNRPIVQNMDNDSRV